MTTSDYQPGEFVEKVESLLDKYPSRPLYWLVNGDGNSFWQWDAYQRWGQDRWKVSLVATVNIPTGDVFGIPGMQEARDLVVIPVYLLRITKVP